ncbi:hypothetical protein EAX61_13120 [Dokdonia sinensis]|uniref:Lipoprotein n=1 Tax=Dokdonia sinensis TaxID=2479847 RepID=A0A3M0G3G3_9FLAO|nr:hypothetical protein [Dokdonia sinensis]RMB56742.1 hypothetical protein EAX61_13120 [Dokdonia sinensis]
MKNLFLGLAVVVLMCVASCSVNERIVFNEQMGGTYTTAIDMSSILQIASEGRPVDTNKELKKKDTTIVFSEILELYKDSIAALPTEERLKIERLKDFTLNMKMDETTSEFYINVEKRFSEFSDIERVAYEVSDVLNKAKTESKNPDEAPNPADDLMSLDKVLYAYDGTTFSRRDPARAKEQVQEGMEELMDEETEEQSQGEEPLGMEMMMDQMMGEFTSQLEQSYMTLEYVFPRKVVSVSQEGATVSEDGKTVIFKVDWKTLMDDKEGLLNDIDIVLEKE